MTYVDVFLEADFGLGSKRGEDGTLRATLGDILVLKRLCRCEAVVLVEQLSLVDRVCPEQSISDH